MFALTTVSARRLLWHCRPVLTNISVRNLNLHEYVSMGLLNDNGIHVPEYHVANTPKEAAHIFRNVLNKRKCNASTKFCPWDVPFDSMQPRNRFVLGRVKIFCRL